MATRVKKAAQTEILPASDTAEAVPSDELTVKRTQLRHTMDIRALQTQVSTLEARVAAVEGGRKAKK